mgnify:CR=1 FL=1|jgi:23S rRNA (cytosine1962-C5)-methyltransferase
MSAFSHPILDAYQLLDSGNGEKLECFGGVTLRRPDPQALWRPRLDAHNWGAADYSFIRESDRGGRWEPAFKGSNDWVVNIKNAAFKISLTPFKHVGLFPEQATNWDWVATQKKKLGDVTKPQLLNLFAYTGAASILAAQDGWRVTHVDASRPMLDWASHNANLSNLDSNAIRWVLDDCLKFAKREMRRGKKYEGILLDPPHYGRGPKGEKWQLELHIAPLLEACCHLLSKNKGSFLVLSTYAVNYSVQAFKNVLKDFGLNQVSSGELLLPEHNSSRVLPCGTCIRFER